VCIKIYVFQTQWLTDRLSGVSGLFRCPVLFLTLLPRMSSAHVQRISGYVTTLKIRGVILFLNSVNEVSARARQLILSILD